jgi:hypothetical protein
MVDYYHFTNKKIFFEIGIDKSFFVCYNIRALRVRVIKHNAKNIKTAQRNRK